MRRLSTSLLFAMICTLAHAAFGFTYVWVEAEDAASRHPPEAAGWSELSGPGFSGGKAVRMSGNNRSIPATGLTATWTFDVPRAGAYELWARLGYRPWTAHDWRLDGGDWNTSHRDLGFYQFIKVPVGKGVTEMCWVTYGRLELAAGTHTLDVRLNCAPGKTQVQQNFDCFVLSADPFVPNGQYKPDDAIPVRPLPGSPATDTWWPFQPTVPAGQEATLDLSFMNAPIAARGFVNMKDGDLFFEDGTPVRFWGINAGYWQGRMIYMEHMDADRYADHLARLGFNCVRIHILHATNSLMDKDRDDTQHFDPVKLDRLMYLIAALEKRNIYINLDMLFHRTFKAGDGVGPELIPPEVRPKGQQKYNVSWACGAAAFWHPRVIELNLALQKKLLTYRNPYNGRTLLESPQMAMCTIHNEQSIFWGTTNMRQGRTAEILDELHTAWLQDKYGTQAKLLQAWQVEGQPSPLKPDENLDTGIVKVGQTIARPNGPNAKRAADQVRFLYDMETGFYERVIGEMRGWGMKCPIITSNWRGGGHTTRLVLQASTLGEIVDRHTYFTRPQSMLEAVGKGIPMTGFDQQAGRAFCISEWNHGTRGLFTAETIPLMASVAALQGWDALFLFASGTPTWETDIGGLKSVPGHFALTPVAAMIFRRGDVQPGPLVFERRRDPEFQFSFAPEHRTMTTDPAALRFAGEGGDAELLVPPEVLAVGRVQNAYVDKPAPDLFEEDLVATAWDKQKQTVISATRELEWNYGQRWLRIDTPRTQGACGDLVGRTVTCRDVSFESSNPCAAIIVTALEEKPIPTAKRLLVTAVGRHQPNALGEGAPAGTTAPPCLIEPVLASVSIRTAATQVYALSAAGCRLGPVDAERRGDRLAFKMTGAPGVMYYEVAE